MNASLRRDVDTIVAGSIRAVLPDEAVRRALGEYKPGAGKTPLVAAGKAAWQMARAAVDTLGHVDGGVVVTNFKVRQRTGGRRDELSDQYHQLPHL